MLNFVGYGRFDAKVWFIGMEEAGGGEDNIRKRLLFRQVEDCAEAHKILGITQTSLGQENHSTDLEGDVLHDAQA